MDEGWAGLVSFLPPGWQVQPRTLQFARYVIVFTTFPEPAFAAPQVLQWYRTRWQVELVFERFKSLTQLGHLPKHDDESAKAWLHGKLLVALLVEKSIHHAVAVSPWGYDLDRAAHGVNSSSSSTKSHGPSNPSCHWRGSSANGTTSPPPWPNRRGGACRNSRGFK